jgi:predicted RNase H-like nuclease
VTSLVAGIDGCRSGWVMATVPLDTRSSAPLRVEIVTDLRVVLDSFESGSLVAAAIDVPIGLAPDGPRRVDREARHRLGDRRNSVFSAPSRSVLAARTYDEACAISRATSGRAVSRQLFGIIPKIREVDRIQFPGLQSRLFEMHPEVSFAELGRAPMRAHKRKPEGRQQRLELLRCAFSRHANVEVVATTRVRGARPDDVLDALVGAWTARRFVHGTHLHLGGEVDETGLRMEMIA